MAIHPIININKENPIDKMSIVNKNSFFATFPMTKMYLKMHDKML